MCIPKLTKKIHSHILHFYPDLFDGVGTMGNVLVHLDIDKNVEPVVQALHKIPHSM